MAWAGEVDERCGPAPAQFLEELIGPGLPSVTPICSHLFLRSDYLEVHLLTSRSSFDVSPTHFWRSDRCPAPQLGSTGGTKSG